MIFRPTIFHFNFLFILVPLAFFYDVSMLWVLHLWCVGWIYDVAKVDVVICNDTRTIIIKIV